MYHSRVRSNINIRIVCSVSNKRVYDIDSYGQRNCSVSEIKEIMKTLTVFCVLNKNGNVNQNLLILMLVIRLKLTYKLFLFPKSHLDLKLEGMSSKSVMIKAVSESSV